jgi:hypothetical protein
LLTNLPMNGCAHLPNHVRVLANGARMHTGNTIYQLALVHLMRDVCTRDVQCRPTDSRLRSAFATRAMQAIERVRYVDTLPNTLF